MSDLTEILKRLKAVVEDLERISEGGAKADLTDDQFFALLDILRQKGVWSEKNDATMKRLSGEGGRSEKEVFAALTQGNKLIRGEVEAVLATASPRRKSAKE